MKKHLLLAALMCALPPLAFAANDTPSNENPGAVPEIMQTQQPASAPAATMTLQDEIQKPSVSETARAAVFNSTLDEVVVTATRIEQPLKQTLSSTTVITQEDIKNSQAADVPTILHSVAGVEVSQNGGYGKTSNLYLRGSNETQVLVLLDGVRINSATKGTTAIESLMLDQVERIEVVRGNVSSLYGSEAIGGVVQIFTKRGRGEPVFNFSAGAGNHGTQRAAAGFGGKVENTDFSLQVSRFRTDGVSAINPDTIPVTTYSRANPDKDGYENTSISANARHAFNNDHSLTATAFNSQGQNSYDGTSSQNLNKDIPTDIHTSDIQVSKFSLISDNRINENWQSKLQLAHGSDSNQNFKNSLPTINGITGLPSSKFQTDSQQLSWQNILQIDTSKQLLAGGEYLNQQVTSDLQPAYTVDSRIVNSLFAGYTGNYGAHKLQTNLRQDNNSQYGIANTGLLGYGFTFTEAWRATASYSTAFRAPTFNELYFPNYGNPDLKPEQSRNMEASVHYTTGNQNLDLTYFDNRTQDLINAVLIAPATYQAQNTSEARIDGLELSYAGQFGDTGIKTAVTLQNPRDITNNKALTRRSTTHSSVAAMHKIGDLQFGAEWLYSYTRTDSGKTLPEYHVFNLTAAYTLSKQWKASFRADNLTDQNDSNAYGYNPLGRTFFANLSYQQ
jgi:vitamin B12 transporter